MFDVKPGLSAATTEHATVKSKLTYPEFLDALVVLGERMYRTRAGGRSRSKSAGSETSASRGGDCEQSVESTFQQVRYDAMVRFLHRCSTSYEV